MCCVHVCGGGGKGYLNFALFIPKDSLSSSFVSLKFIFELQKLLMVVLEEGRGGGGTEGGRERRKEEGTCAGREVRCKEESQRKENLTSLLTHTPIHVGETVMWV